VRCAHARAASPISMPLAGQAALAAISAGRGQQEPRCSGVGGLPQKNLPKGNGGGLSQTPVALLLSLPLALASHIGRELLNEHLGVVLKDVVDGKGKRLGINVRPVFAAELQIILKGGEVHAGQNLFINIIVKIVKDVSFRHGS
jgi:hypothetical protein